MPKTAIVIGATGLTGGCHLKYLLEVKHQYKRGRIPSGKIKEIAEKI